MAVEYTIIDFLTNVCYNEGMGHVFGALKKLKRRWL